MNNPDPQNNPPQNLPPPDERETVTDAAASASPGSNEPPSRERVPPAIPDHELLRCIGRGSYGEVWLARNVMGAFRAVKIVYRETFDSDRPYEREYKGIQKLEPISRRHESQVDILHVGRNDKAGYFYYVMELADDGGGRKKEECRRKSRPPATNLFLHSSFILLHSSITPPRPSAANSSAAAASRATSA